MNLQDAEDIDLGVDNNVEKEEILMIEEDILTRINAITAEFNSRAEAGTQEFENSINDFFEKMKLENAAIQKSFRLNMDSLGQQLRVLETKNAELQLLKSEQEKQIIALQKQNVPPTASATNLDCPTISGTHADIDGDHLLQSLNDKFSAIQKFSYELQELRQLCHPTDQQQPVSCAETPARTTNLDPEKAPDVDDDNPLNFQLSVISADFQNLKQNKSVSRTDLQTPDLSVNNDPDLRKYSKQQSAPSHMVEEPDTSMLEMGKIAKSITIPSPSRNEADEEEHSSQTSQGHTLKKSFCKEDS